MSDPAPYPDMELHDEHVPEELFAEFLARMPQACVEVLLDTEDGVLVANRTDEPRTWFWPGGRLYKGEKLEDAACRIAREELGIDVRVEEQLGPYAHFWEGSPVEGSPSRHTVNVVYRVTPADDEYEIVLDDQHSDYRFLSEVEPDLHEYVRRYLREGDIL